MSINSVIVFNYKCLVLAQVIVFKKRNLINNTIKPMTYDRYAYGCSNNFNSFIQYILVRLGGFK